MNVDWENLGKRLMGANQLGIRIEQDSGHRWISTDVNADFLPACFKDKKYDLKVYGSYQSALDEIDAVLEANRLPSLLQEFESINHYNDLSVVFGAGVQ